MSQLPSSKIILTSAIVCMIALSSSVRADEDDEDDDDYENDGYYSQHVDPDYGYQQPNCAYRNYSSQYPAYRQPAPSYGYGNSTNYGNFNSSPLQGIERALAGLLSGQY